MKTVCNLLKECLEHFSNTGIVPAELLLLSFLFDHKRKNKTKKLWYYFSFLHRNTLWRLTCWVCVIRNHTMLSWRNKITDYLDIWLIQVQSACNGLNIFRTMELCYRHGLAPGQVTNGDIFSDRDSEGPDQTAHMRSLIWAFTVRIYIFSVLYKIMVCWELEFSWWGDSNKYTNIHFHNQVSKISLKNP